MSELISGKEAKLAWASGETVQIQNTIVDEDFYDLTGDNAKLGVFDLDFYRFRLKPRTISINGIQVPAPFEPKHGDIFWHIDVREICSYNYKQEWSDSDEYLQLGAWRTEEEIKQVVSALREVFK